MTSKKKLYLQRSFLVLFGILISILTVEFGLRFYNCFLNKERTYAFDRNLAYEIAKESVNINHGYDRNKTQEDYRPEVKPDGVIYALGDSFTNGGNLNYSASYPYQLYLKLDKHWTIHNLGVCESTSKDTLKIIKKTLQKSVPKNSVFLILTGATDIFAGQDPMRETLATPLISQQHPKRVNDRQAYPNFLNNFKSFLLIKEYYHQYALAHSNPILKSDLKIVNKLNNIFEAPTYKKCISHNSSGACLGKMLPHSMALQSRDYIMNYLLQLKMGMNSKDYAKKITSLIDYLNIHGDVLEEFAWVDSIATIVFLASKQSQYKISSLIQKLTDAYAKFSHKDKHLFTEAVLNVNEYLSHRDNLLEKRNLRMLEIISLLRKNHIQPVLMTYPLSYSEVNDSIRSISHKTNTPLIDLENIFEKKANIEHERRLLVDYQHLTPRGNKIVAEAVFHYFQEHVLAN